MNRNRSIPRRKPAQTSRDERRVQLVAPGPGHERAFIEAAKRSRQLHGPWVQAPSDAEAYARYLASRRRDNQRGFLIFTDTDELAGVVNVNEIVRGAFQSGYLGYYAFEPFAGKGYLRTGLGRVITKMFREEDLHRLEANVQPGNEASLRLVQRLGFRLEGLSPRYLKIGGRWRDHERWAILCDEWSPPR